MSRSGVAFPNRQPLTVSRAATAVCGIFWDALSAGVAASPGAACVCVFARRAFISGRGFDSRWDHFLLQAVSGKGNGGLHLRCTLALPGNASLPTTRWGRSRRSGLAIEGHVEVEADSTGAGLAVALLDRRDTSRDSSPLLATTLFPRASRARTRWSCATPTSCCRASIPPKRCPARSTPRRISFWSRWRQPIGVVALQRPIRYGLELANTTDVGDQAGVLGFNYLTSVGALHRVRHQRRPSGDARRAAGRRPRPRRDRPAHGRCALPTAARAGRVSRRGAAGAVRSGEAPGRQSAGARRDSHWRDRPPSVTIAVARAEPGVWSFSTLWRPRSVSTPSST